MFWVTRKTCAGEELLSRYFSCFKTCNFRNPLFLTRSFVKLYESDLRRQPLCSNDKGSVQCISLYFVQKSFLIRIWRQALISISSRKNWNKNFTFFQLRINIFNQSLKVVNYLENVKTRNVMKMTPEKQSFQFLNSIMSQIHNVYKKSELLKDV